MNLTLYNFSVLSKTSVELQHCFLPDTNRLLLTLSCSQTEKLIQNLDDRVFPGGPVVKNPACNTGDTGSIPGQRTNIPHAQEATHPVHHTRESGLCN